MAAHKIVQESTPPTPTIKDRHHTIARARRGVRLHSVRRSTATPSTDVETLASIFLSGDGPHGLGAEYVMSAWVIGRLFTTQQQACSRGMKGITSRSTKHTGIIVNTNSDEPRRPPPNIILMADGFMGNTVMKYINIQQSTTILSR
eukprot:scaffold249312_cov72-Cyclotella_meneghiniana.AAC.7